VGSEMCIRDRAGGARGRRGRPRGAGIDAFPLARSRAFVPAPSARHRMNATRPPSNDPLHGVTLEALLTELVARHGWAELGRRIDVRCFNYDPSIKSSLKFLRKTPWARQKVEELYLRGLGGRDS
jgi:hypothetical protein